MPLKINKKPVVEALSLFGRPTLYFGQVDTFPVKGQQKIRQTSRLCTLEMMKVEADY